MKRGCLVLLLLIRSSGVCQSETWRVNERCGANCAYGFLKLSGRDVSYDEILAVSHVTSSGSTLADVADAVGTGGVRVAMIRSSPVGLDSLPLPLIAHIEHDNPDEADFQMRGHFVILLRVDNRSVSVMDGTTGGIQMFPRDYFERCWTGYAVVRDAWFRPEWTAALLGSGLGFLAWWRWRRRTAAENGPAS